ncbi:MAG TPA: hypothetical protein VE196_00850 [Pseudonocardiaceae bacterium]|nr:hypothetical protein [Pseudonocardiaceae bacterium]
MPEYGREVGCVTAWKYFHSRHIRTAIDFAAAHREAIDEQVAANDAAAEQARHLAEQRVSLLAS